MFVCLKVSLCFAETEVRYSQWVHEKEGEGQVEGGTNIAVTHRSLYCWMFWEVTLDKYMLFSNQFSFIQKTAVPRKGWTRCATSPCRLKGWRKRGTPGKAAQSFPGCPLPELCATPSRAGTWDHCYSLQMMDEGNAFWACTISSLFSQLWLGTLCFAAVAEQMQSGRPHEINFCLIIHCLALCCTEEPYSTQLLWAVFLKVSMWLISVATVNIKLFINCLTGTLWSPFE